MKFQALHAADRDRDRDCPRRVAIVGSRHLSDYREFCSLIRPHVRAGDVIVSGGAAGIDSLAARFARQNHHELIEHRVDDARVYELQVEYPREKAFAIAANERNQRIVDELNGADGRDVMLAIKCQHSRGTLNSIALMRKHLGLGDREHCPRMRLVVWQLACGK